MSLPPHNRSITAPTTSTAILSLPQSLLKPHTTSLTSTKPLLSFSLSLTLALPPSPSPSLSSRYSRSSSASSSSTVARVSTATVEYAPPPPPDFNFHEELTRLKSLRSRLSKAVTVENKLNVIGSDPRVRKVFDSRLDLSGLSLYEVFLLKCLVAAGQEHVLCVPPPSSQQQQQAMERETVEESARSSVKSALFALVEIIERLDGNGYGKERAVSKYERDEELDKLLKILDEIEQFYDCIGGIIGYQIMVLELLSVSTKDSQSQSIQESIRTHHVEIHPPNGLDLSRNTEYASQAALWGIEGLPDLGEIYPLGGSADRLGLVDAETGECLPAAMLPFCGRTLLEGLIRDLQAREFLYFKLYGRQCITPVAIMTSPAKNNHEHIKLLCEKQRWFGRGRSRFQLFEQPLVPAISAEDGQWVTTGPYAPVCKPGGHGVIWKLAYDKGVFSWFYDHGRKGATVRQISNVVAATDVTLLALSGIGLRQGKKLGFASCKRNSGATEGVNVLIEKKNPDGRWAYGISCIEYTEFDKFGINEKPDSPSSLQAGLLANTNILYVDLKSSESVASREDESSLPGMVLNTKKPIVYVDYLGNRHSVKGGRLECTMQNIADNFFNAYSSRVYKGIEDELDTFLVSNERRRVTSSAKKKWKNKDQPLHQTPDGALLDKLRNAHDLLSQCNINLPEIEGNDKYVNSGPPFLILLHPGLGPLWEVSRQKFSGGSISEGSELKVEVAEFLWRDVQLDGSLIIEAGNVMGSTTVDESGEPILRYGYRCGRCKLQNVKVLNDGIDWKFSGNVYWKNDLQRSESLKIILHGNAEFEANDVTIQGNHVFEVPDGQKLTIVPGNTGFSVQLHPIEADMIDTGSWYWDYKINGSHVLLELVEL